jgi:hypothetical protein
MARVARSMRNLAALNAELDRGAGVGTVQKWVCKGHFYGAAAQIVPCHDPLFSRQWISLSKLSADVCWRPYTPMSPRFRIFCGP